MTVAGFALLSAMLFAAAPVALAQPVHLQPGSALVFPLYDSSPGAGTVICVTNTNDSRVYCPDSDYREGDVALHYVYVDGESCLEFDRYELLTPGDTFCVVADKHNPEQDRGFLFVAAVDPSDYTKYIKFDYLIGSAITVQSDLNFMWSYTPYAFIGAPGQPGSGGECDPYYTDAGPDGDDDGALDFDGKEYSYFPAELFIDSFLEEVGQKTNALTLMSTTGQDYIAEILFLFWNNIEEKFSKTFKFTCWWTGPLSDISAVVTDLGGDEGEIGVGSIETGWASITPKRILDLAGNPVEVGDGIPPILGVFAQYLVNTDFAAGHALHYTGTLDGLELGIGNGD